MRTIILACVLVSAGCSRPAQPTMAHGKPVEHWLHALQGPDVVARREAVKVLGNVGSADGGVVPALAAALKDRDAGVRAGAARSLLKLGPAAKDAVPELTAAARDRDAKVRDAATEALRQIQSGAALQSSCQPRFGPVA
jgi:HEAT repeat protein